MKTPGITAFGEPITECVGVCHDTCAGQSDWYYICVLRGVAERKVSPIHIRFDSKDATARATYEKISKFMSDYLSSNGRWLNPPGRTRDGRVVHWEPIKPQGRKVGLK